MISISNNELKKYLFNKMNIFINQPSFDIKNCLDGSIYYVDNQNNKVDLILSNLENFARITIHLLYRNLFDCYINTSKGNYILDKQNPSITLIYYQNESWIPLDHQIALPFQSNNSKQELNIKLFENGRMGQILLILSDRGNTSESGKYKMSNLLLTSIPNFHNGFPSWNAKSKLTSNNGEGCVVVFKNENESYSFETLITVGSESLYPIHKGNFGRHIKVLSMGNYDYLIVSAPTKVRKDDLFQNMGMIYIYSYRKNLENRYYFHLEKQIPFPPLNQMIDISGVYNNGMNFGSLFQLEVLDELGFIMLSRNGNLFSYKINNLENVQMAMNDTFKPNFIKILSNNNIYLSKEIRISIAQTSNSLFPVISNTLIDPVELSNSLNLEGFGRIIYPYTNGVVVISRFDFFDFDLNYHLKKRITFKNQIYSFDLFENSPIQRKYCFLCDTKENNVYIFDENYNLIANDKYKINNEDSPTLIRWDSNGQTIFICCSDTNDYENQIKGIGSIARFDLFFDKQNKNISDLFPIFDIDNQLFIQKKSIQTGITMNYLEESIFGLSLISNQSSPSKNVEHIYPVIDNSGILLELNYDVSNSSFLSRFAKFFIYTIPTNKILSSQNQYLGWNDLQMLSYNTDENYEIYSYQKDNKIKVVLLGLSNDIQQPSLRRWNIIESEMSLDPSQNLFPIDLVLSGELDSVSFIRLEKVIRSDKVYFLLYFEKRIMVIDFFEKSSLIWTFQRNITNDCFCLDDDKNLFHLYKETDILLSIYQNPNRMILQNQKMDILEMPQQILGRYLNQSFVLLENYLSDIQVRKFDLNFNHPTQLFEFEELNISNQFENDKWIIDIDFIGTNVQKLILSNYSERNFRFLHKFTQEIFAVPILSKTRFENYKKLYIRQLYVSEKNYLHYEQYEIKDKLPELFYNINFQKYFENKIGLFAEYQFKDKKDFIQPYSDKFIQLSKQNENSFTKYLFYPDKENTIVNYIYDSSQSLVVTTEKGVTGCNFKVYNVKDGVFDFVQSTGDATGKLMVEKRFSQPSLLGFESLDNRQGKVFISETLDISNQSIGIWTFDSISNDLSRNQISMDSFQLSKDTYFYYSPFEEYFLNQIDSNINYFKKINGVFQKFTIPFNKRNNVKMDLLFIDSFMKCQIDNQSFLFVRNNTTNEWIYFGEQVYTIIDKNSLNFELERYYSFDKDISATPTTFLNTNINIQSKFFGDENKNIYCLLEHGIYKISISSPILDYFSFSNNGYQIYTQNQTSKKLIHLPMYNSSNPMIDVLNPLFCPDFYTDWKRDISNNGYFTMIQDGIGFSKNFVFQPVISRKYQTEDFPLTDVSQNVFVYENNILYNYKNNNSQLFLDSSRNISNFEMVIDSDETFFTNSKFKNIYYKEIIYQSSITNFNSFSTDLPIYSSVSPDGKQFLIYQSLYSILFKENINQYPDKYWIDRTIPISNSIQQNMNPSKIPVSFDVDWESQKIYLGFGSLGGKSSVPSKVSILKWDQNEMSFEKDISGGFSFGFDIQFSKDRKYLFVSEPRYGWTGATGTTLTGNGGENKVNAFQDIGPGPEKIPDASGIYQGAIHIFEMDNSGNYQFKKILRSRLTNIGFKFRVSSDNKKLLTVGYSNGNDISELVIMDRILNDESYEIKISLNVYDMCFIGETNRIIVEEKIFFSEGNNSSRFFYLLEELNQCENIITKVATNNPYLVKDPTLFRLKPFGKNYLLLIAEKIIHLMQIHQYKIKYITSIARNTKSSYLSLSQDHRTMLETFQEGGVLKLSICW
jgi:hypothetical protein